MDTATLSDKSTVRTPEVFWTLPDALALIKGLQPQVKQFGFHLCLGGGVLNNGYSKKDLDLYFLPLDNDKVRVDAAKLKAFLGEVWKDGKDMRKLPLGSSRFTRNLDGSVTRNEDYPEAKGSPYTDKLVYAYSGLRIDVFILGMREVEEVEVESAQPATTASAPADPVSPFPTFSDWLRRQTGEDVATPLNRRRAVLNQLRDGISSGVQEW